MVGAKIILNRYGICVSHIFFHANIRLGSDWYLIL